MPFHLAQHFFSSFDLRVNTSYVTVEPKRRKQAAQQGEPDEEEATQSHPQQAVTAQAPKTAETVGTRNVAPSRQEARIPPVPSHPQRHGGGRGSGSGTRELRRARIVITVQRTESYRRWLEENPLQAMIARESDEPSGQAGESQRKPS